MASGWYGSTPPLPPKDKQKGLDNMGDWEKEITPELAMKMRIIIRQFKRCRAALLQEHKINEALRQQVADLTQQLDDMEKTMEAGDKAFLQIVHENRTTPREQVYRYG